MGAVIREKEPVLVNPDCLMAYLIALSFLLIKYLLLPDKILTKAAIGPWGRAEGKVGPKAENKLVEPETKAEDK